MKINIILDKSQNIYECDKYEINGKFLTLYNVKCLDLLSTKIKEKSFKLISVISYEIID